MTVFSTDWIVLPDPRDYHPDHSATGVFELDALRRLNERDDSFVADRKVLAYLVHYPDYPVSNGWWERIANSGVNGAPAISKVLSEMEWLNISLNTEELVKKQHTLACYRTQIQVLGGFMKQFIRPCEIFGCLARKIQNNAWKKERTSCNVLT